MTPFSYRELLPASELRRFVECYWFLTASGSLPEPQPILPDGAMELVIHLGEPFRRSVRDGGELQPLRILVGQMDQPVVVSPTGLADVVGVRFRPTGAHPMLGFPMSALANELRSFDEASELETRLRDAASLQDRVRRLNEWLLPRYGKVPEDRDLERAVARLVALEGGLSVDALASSLGLGPRQLERRFRERVGLGPKRFAKVLRFQSVFRSAAGDARAWAKLALDCGYYDQSHFIRDFKSFTGRSPERFFSRESPLTHVFTRGGRPRRGRDGFVQDGGRSGRLR